MFSQDYGRNSGPYIAGFENFTAQVSLRDPEKPEKYIGSLENWEKAENAILNAAEEKGLNFVIEKGEAAFYGPKLDFMVKDANLKRVTNMGSWQTHILRRTAETLNVDQLTSSIQ